MTIYRALVIVEIEADNEEDAVKQIEAEVSQSIFEGVTSIWENDYVQIVRDGPGVH